MYKEHCDSGPRPKIDWKNVRICVHRTYRFTVGLVALTFWAFKCYCFLTYQFKHMFWVLQRTVSSRRLFWIHKLFVLVETLLFRGLCNTHAVRIIIPHDGVVSELDINLKFWWFSLKKVWERENNHRQKIRKQSWKYPKCNYMYLMFQADLKYSDLGQIEKIYGLHSQENRHYNTLI